jgi:hypothetical protein
MLRHIYSRIVTPKRARWLTAACAIFGILALLLVPASTAQALDTSVFELDGNAVTNNTNAGVPDDWDRVCHSVLGTDCSTTNNANTSIVEFASQGATTGTTFAGGGSKDPLDVTGWAWNQGTGGLPGKDILLNGFTAEYTTPASASCPGSTATLPCKQLFFGMDRFDNSGDAQNGFWFFQNPISLGSTKIGGALSFNGRHKDGDVLVVSDFSIGGTVSTVNVYKWNHVCTGAGNPMPSCADSNLEFLNGSTSANCATPAALAGAFCGIVNPADGATSPWPFKDKAGNTSFAQGEFYEGGIDLSAFDGLANECFASTLAESRASTSTSATLKSFVLGSLPGCTPTVKTTPQNASGGDIAQGSVSITGAGAITVQDKAATSVAGTSVWTGSVAFFLCGPADLAAQPSCISGGTSIGSVNVSNLNPTVTSPQATITSAAPSVGAAPFNYCWRGVFTVNIAGVSGSTDDSTGECFTVTPVTPTLTTQASASPVQLNNPISDTATLTGTANEPGTPVINPTTAGGHAQGTITFTVFGPNSCTTVATTLTSSVNGDGTYTVSFTPTAVGVYVFDAAYPGDAPNTTAAATVACAAEPAAEAVTVTDTSSASSTQKWLPNDSASIASGSGKPSLNGTLTLQLFDGSSNCTTGAVASQLYTQAVTAAASATIMSNNTSYFVNATDNVSWLVTFTSSDPNVAGSSHCESTSLTITN